MSTVAWSKGFEHEVLRSVSAGGGNLKRLAGRMAKPTAIHEIEPVVAALVERGEIVQSMLKGRLRYHKNLNHTGGPAGLGSTH